MHFLIFQRFISFIEKNILFSQTEQAFQDAESPRGSLIALLSNFVLYISK